MRGVRWSGEGVGGYSSGCVRWGGTYTSITATAWLSKTEAGVLVTDCKVRQVLLFLLWVTVQQDPFIADRLMSTSVNT